MSRRYRFWMVDVFTHQRFGGNPLAVLTAAEGLTDTEMQQIAREFNFSETTFVLPPTDPSHQARFRIFTPARELPFAGHPTLGTAWVLQQEGAKTDMILEVAAGQIPISQTADQLCFEAPQAPHCLELAIPPAKLAALLNLHVTQLAGAAVSASCGTPYVLVPLCDHAALAQARYRPDEALLARWPGLAEVYLYTPPDAQGQMAARLFAPGAGIDEDPATGSAAAALAGWLLHPSAPADAQGKWCIQQGHLMGRPSQIEASARRQQGRTRVWIRGQVVPVAQGELWL
ncbi:MAG: PhzF family phenazine biosynthesis protein [Candidatus Sericytochromatia bacterium]